MWQGIGSIFLILFSMSALSLSLRQDLDAPLANLICQKKLPSPPPTSTLWKKGIHDAGILVYVMTDLKRRDPLARLEKMAKSFAEEQYHLGYSFGSCSKSRHWIATTPAPMPLRQRGSIFRLDARRMYSHCKWFRIDYAHALHSKPRRLFRSDRKKPVESILANTTLLQRGTLSVTCKPKKPKWLGPVLWSLQPIKQGPYDKALLSQHLKHKNIKGALKTWINRIRQDMGLSALNTSSKRLKEITKPLISQNFSIHHNRSDIRTVSSLIKEQHGRFLGENRVQANNFQEAAWLLWNSPRHRSLMLHSKATHLTTLGRPLKSEELAVMVFAKF